jgi:hypothetical protein
MNVEIQTMDPNEARRHYLDYRRSVRQLRDKRRREARLEADRVHSRRTQIEKEENDLRAAYRAMSLGQRVIVLPSALRKAGLNAQGLPVLAVAQAHWEWCNYSCNHRGISEFYDGSCRMNFQLGGKSAWGVRALVPPVPPQFRPENLYEYHVLWDAEWQKAPPVDPILLKKVSDNVFIVLAQWDLTPLERAVLEGRFA